MRLIIWMVYSLRMSPRDLGADVKLVMGSTQSKPPENVELIPVQSAQDMYEAVTREWDDADIVVKAAAVADYARSDQTSGCAHFCTG